MKGILPISIMNKHKKIYLISVLLGLLLISCEKVYDDKIPPTIILNGDNQINMLIGCSFIDPGAFASDDKSEPVIFVSGDVNTDSAGVYNLEYMAVDSDSNKAYVQRIVVVEAFNFDIYQGVFDVHDTLETFPSQHLNYNASVDLFIQSPKTFRISNFNNFGEHFKVLFEPDSYGTFQIEYNNADTIIQGNGETYCDKSGFRISYTVETQEKVIITHKTSFK